MNIQIIDNGTSFLDQLVSLSGEFGNVDVVNFGEVDQHTNADMLILSGGHSLPVLGHEAEFANELGLIDVFSGPIIGICLGHELIVHWDGGELQKASAREHGMREINVIHEDPVFAGEQRFNVYESHRWSVKSTQNLTPLAESDTGIEVVRHPDRLIYGFQFHPEQIGGAADGSQLFKRAITAMGRSI